MAHSTIEIPGHFFGLQYVNFTQGREDSNTTFFLFVHFVQFVGEIPVLFPLIRFPLCWLRLRRAVILVLFCGQTSPFPFLHPPALLCLSRAWQKIFFMLDLQCPIAGIMLGA
jgi:hypothetical protein